MNGQTPEIQIEHLLREVAPQALGVVARRFRDFSLAEDAVQEALLAAFRQWPQEGIPENPLARGLFGWRRGGWRMRCAARWRAGGAETVMKTAE